ncbi:MAG: hypothetical protein Q8S14_19460 [Algoriphagus sp.]|jgi:beta-lactamase regulating signal transducer with metallopeptidase domain|uniref:hypothetical protein n=1 Tax=Algoriphagus sp. TaxID=1872435 RepID=UPI002728B72D|nr:hypothetical protein [Algoriphagus sp.]MDO8968665.1 hypothetical protein [Algoriphagus sp.]MDP2039760.1 hypothetical protein [Algoriphagus sp.]MDP3200313.1 hypothetical protein [Algoriphagus sp.]MDP3474056.1 hypothetical protein [Algoriphagus sp.]
MVAIKPKISTYISLTLILLVLLVGLILLLRDFAYTGSFALWFYLVACSLITLVLLMLLVKMMAGWRFITAGKDHIIIKLPLKGMTKVYPINEILLWEEEVVVANKKEFKQVTIAFTDKNSISVSNHEHESYTELINYLKKKAIKQMIKSKKA